MADLTAVLWTRATGAPRRLATLVVNEAGALSVSYDGGAIKDRLPGMSAMHDLAIRRDVVYLRPTPTCCRPRWPNWRRLITPPAA